MTTRRLGVDLSRTPGPDVSGLLTTDKWATSAGELVDSLLDVVMIAVDAGDEA